MLKKIAFYFVGLAMLMNCNSQKSINELVVVSEGLEPISSVFSFTEGPATDKEGNVFFTDQPNDKIYVWDWSSNQINLFTGNSGRANGMYFNSKNQLVACSDNKGEMWKFDDKGNKIEVILSDFEGKRLNGPNDLWIDSKDGIYFTDPLYVRGYWADFKQEIPQKNLYYRNPKGEIVILDTFVQPNGIIGSEKLNKLYVSDIDDNKTYVYDIEAGGKLRNKKIFCELGSDGMTLDEKGNLYITGKGVSVFNPNGKQILHIPVPEEWTSNVTFGGEDNKTLFITASKSVYQTKMNVSGIK